MRSRGPRLAGEDGYAMVAAVAGIAVFAMMALALVESGRSSIVAVQAEVGQAKAAAAADAGLAIALNGLLTEDRADRWSIDNRPRQFRFADTDLLVRVEDERGKVPINLLDEEFAGRLIETLQPLSLVQERVMRDSLLDWLDEDEEPRSDGAESADYAERGYRSRNGPIQSIDELAKIRGFDGALVERLRPYVTLHFGQGTFDGRYAHPLAIGVMQGGGIGNPAVIERQRELEGQRTAIEVGDAIDLNGRPLMIRVDASRADGARARRAWIIELTGNAARPFVIRSSA